MTDNNGWVKLHRKMLDSAVFDNPKLLKLWIWCLCKSAHKGYKTMVGNQVVSIGEGQLIFGRKKAASELKISESMAYEYIKMLEKLEMVNIKSNNKFTVITIVNWEVYQCVECDDQQQIIQQSNNKATTNHTTKQHKQEYKEYKECKEVIYSEVPELNSAIISFIDYRKEIHKPMSRKEVDEMIGKLDDMTSSDDEKIRILNQSMKKGWVGIFPLKEKKKNQFMTAESHQYNFEELERILLANSEGGNNNG